MQNKRPYRGRRGDNRRRGDRSRRGGNIENKLDQYWKAHNKQPSIKIGNSVFKDK